ncbi:MAG: hypothetical protein HGB04_03965 [Chlorobiaceae bacterium]|nr:hypothetical protein [Chlorobiaceae bacterium]
MAIDLFARLSKIDEAKREVWGIAVAEVPDKAKEIFDYQSSKPNFEKWSADVSADTDGASLGNLRAMHGKVAAGKLTSIEFDDENKQIEVVAKVIDDNEWQKVLEGVYTGFSIGGDYMKKWADGNLTRYTANPNELSLVDRPCVPTAKFYQVIKSDGTTEQRELKVEEDAPAGQIEKVDGAEDHDLKKYAGESIFDVRQATACLSDILWLFMDEVGEAETNPDQIQNLKGAIDNLKAFIISEIQEPDPDLEAAAAAAGQAAGSLAMADQTGELAKAGKEISAKNAEKVQQIHDHSVSMGAECAKCDGADKADGAGSLAKAEGLEKSLGDLAKRFDDLEKMLTKSTVENEALTKRIKTLEETPMPAKGVANAVAGLAKADDNGIGQHEIRKQYDAKGEEDEVATALAKVFDDGPISVR